MNFREFLHEHRIPYAEKGSHHHAREGWLQLDCPDCSPRSGRMRLGFNLSRGYFACWTCGSKRTVDVLQSLGNLDWRQAKEYVANLDVARQPKNEPKRTGKLRLPTHLEDLQPVHRRYLEKRQFDPDELVRVWKIQGTCGLSKPIPWRIFIPVYYQGEVVSWTARAVSKSAKVRYYSAKEGEEALPHKELLFGEDFARNAVIIHEGPFDVFRTGPGAVCTFGTAFRMAQVMRLVKYPVRVVCFDSTTEGQTRADRLVRLLSSFPGTTVNVRLETGKDAADLGASAEVQELRRRFLDF